jgi:hypothetical protein
MDLLIIKNNKEVMEVFNPINVIRATVSKKNQTVTWFFVDGSFSSMDVKEVTPEIKTLFQLELKDHKVVIETPHSEPHGQEASAQQKALSPVAKSVPLSATDDDNRDNE